MYKGTEIKGLRVITSSDGKEAGRVEDLLVSTETGLLLGIIVEGRGILKNVKYIKLEHITNFGKDAVIISSLEDMTDSLPKGERLSWINRLGKNAFSAEGTDIGTVQDVFFEFPGGQVLGIEMSGGIWADLNQGRKMIPWHLVVSGHGENFIVRTKEQDLWQ